MKSLAEQRAEWVQRAAEMRIEAMKPAKTEEEIEKEAVQRQIKALEHRIEVLEQARKVEAPVSPAEGEALRLMQVQLVTKSPTSGALSESL